MRRQVSDKGTKSDESVDESTLRELTERMTCHGLQDLYRAKSKVTFFFWATVLTICTATLCYSIYHCFKEFHEKPILTSNEVESSDEMQFPDLTICPTDFINYTKLGQINDENPDAAGRVWDFKKWLGKRAGLLLDGGSFVEPGDHAIQYGHSWSLNYTGSNWESKSLAAQHEEIFNTSLDINAFVLLSPIHDIKRTLDLENGVCYVLNATAEKLNQSIPHMGIQLLVDTDSDIKNDSDPNDTPLVDGITIRTGHPEYHPMSRGGILIPTGSYAKLSLSVKKEHFISVSGFTEVPTHCVSDGDVELSILNVSYTQEACELDCFAAYELEKYKCIIATNMTFLKVQNFTNNVTPCSNMKYYKKHRKNKMLQNCSKKCHKECDLTTYEIATTILKIPSKKLLYQLNSNQGLVIAKLCRPKLYIIDAQWSNETCMEESRQSLAIYKMKCKLATAYEYNQYYVNITSKMEDCNETQISEIDNIANQDYEWCQKPCGDTILKNALNEAKHWESNVILFEVVFQDFKTRVISQRHSMTPITLMSNLGGTLGLWLGASFFTILQIIVLLLEACVDCCERRNKRRISEEDSLYNYY